MLCWHTKLNVVTSILEWPSAAWTWISSHIIVTKYRRKQIEHSPLWTTAWCMLTLLFSIAVKYLLHSRNLWFQAHMLSCCRRWTLQMGCQPFQQHENYAIALASLHMLNTGNKFENTFSNTQHFVVYVTLHALLTAWCTLDKASHLTAFGAWDSTPHLLATPASSYYIYGIYVHTWHNPPSYHKQL